MPGLLFLGALQAACFNGSIPLGQLWLRGGSCGWVGRLSRLRSFFQDQTRFLKQLPNAAIVTVTHIFLQAGLSRRNKRACAKMGLLGVASFSILRTIRLT